MSKLWQPGPGAYLCEVIILVVLCIYYVNKFNCIHMIDNIY
jgi:hypothetical protein